LGGGGSSVTMPSGVHHVELVVLAVDLGVLGRDARIGDLDLAGRAAPDGHRVGGQLDLLVRERAAEEAQ
jgi:hypothetical protein